MQISLRDALKEFPRNKEIVIHNDIPDNFKQLSYIEKYKYFANPNSYKEVAVVSCTGFNLFFGIKRTSIKRYGRNIFLVNSWRGVVTYKNGKLNISEHTSNSDIKYLFMFINRPIVNDLNTYELSLLCKKTMLQAVLCNKIYGLESFYRQYMSIAYHLKNFDWRLFREFINRGSYLSVLDLIAFTKDLRASMTRVIDSCKGTDSISSRLLFDLVESASKLGEVVDLTWSERRIREEHLRQTRELMSREIASKSGDIVYDAVFDGPKTIKLLNNEKEVFEEGNIMHHCLYTCYWSRIKAKQYIAFHMTSPEDCTFSVRLIDGEPYLDQIYLSYDRPVQDSTKTIAKMFMYQNSDIFKQILK